MEVNNNTEINKMFGTEDNPVSPPARPALQTSPLGVPVGTPANSSPFQEDSTIEATPDFSGYGDSPTSSENPDNYDPDIIIGNHDGFSLEGADNGRKIGIKIMLVLLPLMLVFGAAAGAFACFVYFFGLNISAEHSAAKTAVKSVNELFAEEKVIFADIFVNNKSDRFECIVFSVIEEEPTRFYNKAFMVVINKSTDEVSVFNEYNQEEYDRLREGTEAERVQAEILLSRRDYFEHILNEIRDENDNWKRIDPFYLLVRIKKG